MRNKLIAAFLAVSVPLFGLLTWRLSSSYREREGEMIEEQRERAMLLAATYANWIDRLFQMEELLADYVTRGTRPGQLHFPFHDVLRLNPVVSAVSFVDARGHVVFSTSGELAGRDLSDDQDVRAIRAGRPWVIGDLYEDAGGSFFVLVRQVREPGGPLRGAIIMRIAAESLGMLVGFTPPTAQPAAAGRPTHEIVVTDAAGRVAFDGATWKTASAAHRAGRRTWRDLPFVADALQGRVGLVGRFREPGGDLVRMGAQVPVGGYGWTVGSFVDVRHARSPGRRAFIVQVVILLSIVGASVVVAVSLGRKIAGTVRSLKLGVEAFGRGDLSHRISSDAGDELGELALTFNDMADRLREREQRLERLVDAERIARGRSESLNEELTEEIGRHKILHAIASAASENLEIAAVARAAVDGLVGAFGLTAASIWLVDSPRGVLSVVARSGSDPSGPSAIPLAGAGGLARVVDSGQPLFVEDTATGGVPAPVPDGFFAGSAVRSVVAIPLRTTEATIGIIVAGSPEPRHFRWRLREFLATVGNQVAIAAEKIRHVDRTRSEKQFTDYVLDHIPAGVLVLDPADFTVVKANRQYLRFLGRRQRIDTLIGRGFAEFTPRAEEDGLLPILRKVAATGETATLDDFEYRGSDESPMYWSLRLAPLKDRRGHVARVLMLVVDATDQVQDRRQKDEFLAIASHELKTPITAIKGLAQALMRQLERKGSVNREFLEIINHQSDRLVRLINDLLDLSRIQTGRLGLRRERADLADIARTVVQHFQPTTDRHVFECHAEPDRIVGVWDRQRLEQILSNLVMNAVKYSPGGGRVLITLAGEGGHAYVRVSDEGVGVPKDELPLLFSRFFRASNVSADHISGLGVGLYISREVARCLGGDIQVESQEGKGSTFTLRLPLEVTPPVAPAEERVETPAV